MFVEALKRQNPVLISAALSLWQQGKIAPDSWVIDVDQILENGKRLIETARLYGIELYLMTKQFGRNPWLAEKLLALGYSGIVAVDYKEARVMRRAGLPVAHQGHLVQIPCHQVSDAVEQGTDVITVFTLDKAREISAAAVKAGRVQSVLLKVYSDDDFLYPGRRAVLYSIRCTRWLLKSRICRGYIWRDLPISLACFGMRLPGKFCRHRIFTRWYKHGINWRNLVLRLSN